MNKLTELAREPEQSAESQKICTSHELDMVLTVFNSTEKQYEGPELVHLLFEEQVARTPHAVAITFENTTLSYFALNERANRLAHYLSELGAAPERIVAIYMQRSIDLIVTLLAILKAGAAYVPLEPSLPQKRIDQMLDDCDASLLVTTTELRARLPKFNGLVVEVDGDQKEILEKSLENLKPHKIGVTPHNLAYVIFTSGSTGRPKGAMNEHRGVVNRLKWMQEKYPLSESDCVIQKTPYGFDVSVWEFFWPLFTGARLAIARPEGHKDPSYLIRFARDVNATVIHFVPSMLQIYLEYVHDDEPQTFKRIFCSGEELTASLQNRCLKQFEETQLHNLYGPTEAAVDVTYWDCVKIDQQVRVPIGRPISNVKIYILDNQLNPVPVGVVGEMYIGGLAVGRGYINNTKLTAERFLTDPFNSGGKFLYKTGDTARWTSDGIIEYLGRNDNQVKIRGQRIEIGEIEHKLKQHSAVRDAVVLACDDQGNGKRLVAYLIVKRDQQMPNIESVRDFLAKELPVYMIPSAFVRLSSFPLTNSGKLDRNAFPSASVNALVQEREYVEPRSVLERLIASHWSDVLGVDRVSVNDNFFSLGGDSLSSLKFQQLMMNSGINIDAGIIYLNPTVFSCARCVEEAQNEKRVVLPLPSLNLAPNQVAAMKFAPQSYTSLVLEMKQDIGHDRLALMLNELINRHDAFKQGFLITTNEITCTRHHGPLSITVRSYFSKTEQLNSIIKSLNDELIDLNCPPLMRATHISLNENSYLHLKISHLISDGWSLKVISDELNAVCSKEIPNSKHQMPANAQFVDYLKDSAFILSNTNQERLKEHWQKKLAGSFEFPYYFGLSRNRNNTSAKFDGSGLIISSISGALGRAVKLLAKSLGVSEYGIYSAVYGLMVAASSGAEEFIVMSIDVGRPSNYLGAVGYFMNVLPIPIAVRTGDSATQYVAAVWKELAEARANAPLANDRLYSLLGDAPSDLYSSPCNAFFQMHDVMSPSRCPTGGPLLQTLPIFSIPHGLREDVGLDIYWGDGDELTCYWSYAQDLFTERHLTFLTNSFAGILNTITLDPSHSVSEILSSLHYE